MHVIGRLLKTKLIIFQLVQQLIRLDSIVRKILKQWPILNSKQHLRDSMQFWNKILKPISQRKKEDIFSPEAWVQRK